MIRTLSLIVTMAAALAVSGVASADTWKNGVHYRTLSTPVSTAADSGVEVAEVFWYGCPHCYNFKPLSEAWAEKAPDYVNYVRLPAVLGESWAPHAFAFYALESMGELDKVHDALFEALAVERRPLNSAEALADFVADHGVDAEAFVEAYNSFAVRSRVRQAQTKIMGAQVTGTPTMLVNGKYVVTATMARGHENVLKVVDYLVSKEQGVSK
ncbi:thiol:disulfide interchange protein DsbA/DsbL [Marinobacter sp. S0848L]|uniref:thiol:disulfide interchange protein DsbA/DsbL n=1 Tax=Marinobacter sp. S0848L TaxID=2926423 RepID=UPI001FF2D8A0|nr:thiol:disulfide interchange protein DsbA/DsbL [Marinobacter sp. S0848L]MCK0105882.1 thiol:disulfide interchange protein DsbA/DsbL [Marinobacter sp. S0848L]